MSKLEKLFRRMWRKRGDRMVLKKEYEFLFPKAK